MCFSPNYWKLKKKKKKKYNLEKEQKGEKEKVQNLLNFVSVCVKDMLGVISPLYFIKWR